MPLSRLVDHVVRLRNRKYNTKISEIQELLALPYNMHFNIFGRNAQAGPSRPLQGASSTVPADTKPVEPPLSRYEAALRDEENYQASQYATYDDLPGCMSILDDFLICYALMPQLRNMYRYGELRDCSWKFQDFKYCLSLKSEPEESRRQLWIKRKAEWWAHRRISGSSEDVWDRRSEPLENFPPLYPDDPVGEPASHTTYVFENANGERKGDQGDSPP